MNRKYFFAITCAALICLFVIFVSMWKRPDHPDADENKINASRPTPPFKSYITGVGVIEAGSDNIYINSPINRLVQDVPVQVGEKVAKGQVLIRLDDRDLQAQLFARKIAYDDAKAKLQKLEWLPRREDVVTAEAQLKISQVQLEQAKSQYDMVLALKEQRALSQEEINKRKFNFLETEAKWQQAKVELDKIKAGTWKPDIEIARFEVEQAKANMDLVKADLARTIIHSPIDGTILQIKIHEGEYPSQDPSKPMMILGDLEELNLRVSINQFNSPYFRKSAPALAFLQGDTRTEFPLAFLRIEPILINKQNLTNDITEKVDTRVLQVIYRIKNETQALFVGQQMDVYIEAENSQEEET